MPVSKPSSKPSSQPKTMLDTPLDVPVNDIRKSGTFSPPAMLEQIKAERERQKLRVATVDS